MHTYSKRIARGKTWKITGTKEDGNTDHLSYANIYKYGVATISRLLKIIGLFCKRAL